MPGHRTTAVICYFLGMIMTNIDRPIDLGIPKTGIAGFAVLITVMIATYIQKELDEKRT